MTPPPIYLHKLFIVGLESILGNEELRADNVCASAKDVKLAKARLPVLIKSSGLYGGKMSLEEFYEGTPGTGRRGAREDLGLKIDFPGFRNAWNSHYTPDHKAEEVLRSLAADRRVVALINTEASASACLKENFDIMQVPHRMYESHHLGMEKPDVTLLLRIIEREGFERRDAVVIDRDLSIVNAAAAVQARGIRYRNAPDLVEALERGGVRLNSVPDVTPLPQVAVREMQPRRDNLIMFPGPGKFH